MLPISDKLDSKGDTDKTEGSGSAFEKQNCIGVERDGRRSGNVDSIDIDGEAADGNAISRVSSPSITTTETSETLKKKNKKENNNTRILQLNL